MEIEPGFGLVCTYKNSDVMLTVNGLIFFVFGFEHPGRESAGIGDGR